MKKICLYTLSLTLVLLVFFSVGGSTIARASATCKQVTNAIEYNNGDTYNVNGEYIQGADIEGNPAWYKAGTNNIIFYDNGYPAWAISDCANGGACNYEINKYVGMEVDGHYISYGGNSGDVSSITCTEVTPPALTFSPATTILEAGVGISSISVPLVGNFMPWLYLVAGLFVGYWIVNKIWGIFHGGLGLDEYMQGWRYYKEKKETYDELIARSERDIAETERLIKETTH